MTDFTLRPWREADAASIARYADNAKIAANLRDVFPCPYAPQDAATFVESCIRQEGRGQMCRAIEVYGEAAAASACSWAAMYTGGAQSWATGWESPSGAAGS